MLLCEQDIHINVHVEHTYFPGSSLKKLSFFIYKMHKMLMIIILLLFRFYFSFYLKFIFSMQRLTLWFATLLMVFKTINICLGWLLADLPWVPVHKDLHAVAEGAGGGRAGLTGALRPLSRFHPRPSAGHHQGRSTSAFGLQGCGSELSP